MTSSPLDATMSQARPYVICHMMASIDGRIIPSGWPISAGVRQEYEVVHASYDADGWICGRVTMESFAKRLRSQIDVAREHTDDAPRDDYIAPGDHESYAFAIDGSGRLAWESNDVDGDHVVTILSKRVSDDYLAFLRKRQVSYLLAGVREVDLAVALEKITLRLGVRTLMLEGGGRINGGLLRAGLIDEVSLLCVPVVDGRIGSPALFDVDRDEVIPHRLTLKSVEQRVEGVLWIRYGVEALAPAAIDHEPRST